MAGAAGVGISLVVVLMPEVPRPAVDAIHAMGTIEGEWQTGVTAAARADGSGMTL